MAVIPTASGSPNSIFPRTAFNGGLSKEAIVGIVTGLVGVFLSLASLVFLLCRRRLKTKPLLSLPQHQSQSLAPHIQPSVAGPSRASPAPNEKPVVVDEKQILGLDDASYLSRLPGQQG
jgi:hypothetical protein